MNDKRRIENVSVLYNNHKDEKKFVKAYAMIDGKFQVIEGHTAVNDLLVDLKRQENVKGLQELSRDMISTKFMYDKKEAKKGNYVLSSDLENWKAKQEDKNRMQNAKLARKSPYTDKKASKITAGRVALATIATGIMLSGCAALGLEIAEANMEAPKARVMASDANIDTAKDEKKNPESWEEYLTYKDSTQKKFLVQDVMDTNLKNAVKTLTIDSVDKKVGIPAEEMGALLLYYGGNLYTDEELAQIVGDYDLTVQTDSASNLIAERDNALFDMGLNIIYAKDMNEVFIPVIGDEVADQANKRVFTALYEVTHATGENYSKKQEELTEILAEYNLNGETKINFQEHPAADIHLEVAAEVHNLYQAFNSNKLLISAGYCKKLFGTEAVQDVEQVGTVIRTRGLNDIACNILDAKMESVMSYIHGMDKEEFKALTKDTYSLPYMYDLMNDYLVREMGLESVDALRSAYDDIYKSTMAKTGSTDPRGDFNPHTNPAGGKKGDKFTETQKGVKLDPASLTEEQKRKAEEEENKRKGLIDEDDIEKEVKKATLKYIEVYNATFNHFAEENVKEATKAYSSTWEKEYPGAWAEGKKDGLKYKADKAKEGVKDEVDEGTLPGSTTPDPSDTWDPGSAGEPGGKHEDNPNQQEKPGAGEDSGESGSDEEERIEVPDPTQPSGGQTENPSTGEEEKQENTEQPSSGTDTPIDDERDKIEGGYTGPVTTDPTDAWDPGSAGEYDSQSAEESSDVFDPSSMGEYMGSAEENITYEAQSQSFDEVSLYEDMESFGTDSIDLTEFYEDTYEESEEMQYSKSL